jgi:hypothetical protein
MKILLKMPTRQRPQKFLSVLKKYADLITLKDQVKILVSYDTDDRTMTPAVIDQAKAIYQNIELVSGYSVGKIHACNRDVAASKDWDIVVLASDDMLPQVKGWDKHISEMMQKHFPDTDGVLWFNDGYTFDKLNTMCILGRKYFDRFGYIYHPSYLSLWCDNEFTEVANTLRKQKYFPLVLFKHEHPANTGAGHDALYSVNEAFYHQDMANYYNRKAINFGL